MPTLTLDKAKAKIGQALAAETGEPAPKPANPAAAPAASSTTPAPANNNAAAAPAPAKTPRVKAAYSAANTKTLSLKELMNANEKAVAQQQAEPGEPGTGTPATAPASTQPNTGTATPTPAPAPEQPLPSINEAISQITAGKFKGLEDFIASYNELAAKAGQPAYKDDFIKGAVDYYNSTGDLTPYLEAKTLQVDKLGDDAAIRYDMRKKFPQLSDKSFEKMFAKEMQQYDNDDMDDDDKEYGTELKKIRADQIRAELKKNQQAFSAPALNTQAVQEQQQKILETLKENPVTQQLFTDKKIVVKHKDGDFNYEVSDPHSLFEMLTNEQKLYSKLMNEKGSLDLAKAYRLLSYWNDPDTFERSLINYGKSIGSKQSDDELKNPSLAQTGKTPDYEPADERSRLKLAIKKALAGAARQ